MAGPLKGTLWDMDGVLLPFCPQLHQDAFCQALIGAGYPPVTKEYHDEFLNGLGTPEKLRLLGLPEWDVEVVNYQKQLITKKLIDERCVDQPFIRDVVLYAKSVGKVAIATNCARETALMLLEKAGLRKLFNVIVTSSDVRKKKPSPIPYRQAAAHIGLHASDCLAIDDSNHGIKSAHLAGCKVWELKNPSDLTIPNLMTEMSKWNVIS